MLEVFAIKKELLSNNLIEQLQKETFKQISEVKELNSREYLLHQKFFNLKDLTTKIKKSDIYQVKNQIMTFNDVKEFVEDTDKHIEIQVIDTPEKLLQWRIARNFVSLLKESNSPGRNLRFLVTYKTKILGILKLSSDVLLMKARDDYLGLNKEMRNLGKLRNIANASVLVATQPFGYMLNGGKLLSLLLFHSLFRNIWKERYNDELVGITTTALFGINSQYNGMPKYWKTLGETTGSISIEPSHNFYVKTILPFMKKFYTKELNKIVQQSSPKWKTMMLFYKKINFKQYIEQFNLKENDLKTNFNRGVYFAKFYDNTQDFMENKVIEQDLISRKNLDFDINNIDEIVQYWFRKHSKNRWNRVKDRKEYQDVLFLDDIYHINTVEKFIENYL